MLAIHAASLSFAPVAPMRAPASRATTPKMETVSDLKTLADKLNPAVGYYNPTSLAEMEFWGQSQRRRSDSRVRRRSSTAACDGGLRRLLRAVERVLPVEAHGRHRLLRHRRRRPPLAQWDALPTNAKLQIIGFVGFLEWWGENSYALEAAA